jgi:sulfate transport system ATP-binding protein
MSIVLERLVKRYDGHAAVSNVSLDVAEGEFFVLLGPSGSGKSTVLRMIAGLVEVDQGRILLRGRDVAALPPQQRGVGFVFQHYALFRHMTVAQNIEFPLRVRRDKAAERRRRRDELLELVGLAGLGGRLPDQLSGGQRQRVALARALAHKPDVLLLDEPFGALDARIRAELRGAVRTLQRELGVTTIFVTHDQEEAFELADRLGIMDFGRLHEVGPPQELYLRPQTEFVAGFLGTANLMVGESAEDGIHLGPVHFPMARPPSPAGENRRVQVLFRPEDVAVKDTDRALSWPLLGQAVVEDVSFAGSFERLRLRLPPLPGVLPIAPPAPYGGDSLLLEASRSQHQARRYPLHPGDTAWVGVRRIHALTYPGLGLLLLTDGSSWSGEALAMAGQVARLAHARLAIVAHDVSDGVAEEHLRHVRERLGGGLAGLEVAVAPDGIEEAIESTSLRRAVDLLVAPLLPPGRNEHVEALLRVSDRHLLLVPSGAKAVPTRALICVAVGEPGKEDILFAGRLMRHLSSETTILTVLVPDCGEEEREHARRFLEAGRRTLALLGVQAQAIARVGDPLEEIRLQLEEGRHDLLVVGAPLAGRRGRVELGGIVAELLEREVARPLLIVRSEPR